MRMDTKEHTADTAPAPKAKAEHREREGMGRGPTPRLRGGLIGRCDCSPLDGREVVQAGAGEQENAHCSVGVPHASGHMPLAPRVSILHRWE